MILESTCRIIDRFADENGYITFQSAAEVVAADSIGAEEVKNLIAGANTITVPTGAVGVTIILPDDNEETIALKGISGDTGIALAFTAPVHLSLRSVSSFVLTLGDAIDGVRFIWS